ncbi:hypothetical protein OSSY52_02180 [Tepiditoga spiralis]|uniref:Radical SAM core domain-containing protein n=1 Tax=Tepiditoga spiralis TaxID=2108365 RepID=A0A7G1G5B0_9BACT|nr:radical SAM protein [Tepiditoga spiralis]BBE30077.1 hypothetical protein OSSY52_02180 [Tepiditoga spiralis]
MINNFAPTEINWGLTYSCNLKCNHCYSNSSSQNLKNPLSFDKLKLIMNKIIDAGIFKIIFTGGEPFLNTNLFSLIEIAKKNNIFVHINTNGLLLDDKIIEKLQEYKVDSIRISLDGKNKFEHESLRGKNSNFEKVCSVIEKISKTNITTSIATTINKNNYMSLEEIIKLSINLGAKNWTTFRYVKYNKNSYKYALDKYEYYEILKKLYEYKIKYEKSIELYIEDPLFLFINEGKNRPCPASNSFFAINPKGDVLLCPSIPLKVGSLIENNVFDIWNSKVFLNLRGKRMGCLSAAFEKYNVLKKDPFLKNFEVKKF